MISWLLKFVCKTHSRIQLLKIGKVMVQTLMTFLTVILDCILLLLPSRSLFIVYWSSLHWLLVLVLVPKPMFSTFPGTSFKLASSSCWLSSLAASIYKVPKSRVYQSWTQQWSGVFVWIKSLIDEVLYLTKLFSARTEANQSDIQLIPDIIRGQIIKFVLKTRKKKTQSWFTKPNRQHKWNKTNAKRNKSSLF